MFGTRRIKGLNTLWYGSIKYDPVRKRVKAGFKKKNVITGYRYLVAMQFGIAYGFTGMILKSLYVGDDVIFETDQVSGSNVFFTQEELYGGNSQGGGVSGLSAFYNGVDNLAVPLVVSNNLPLETQLPQYVNTATVALSDGNQVDGMYIGTSKQVRAISIVISNTNFIVNSGEPITNGIDVNPVSVLRHILVSDSRFIVLTAAEVDLLSLDVAEQQVWDEGLLFSPIFTRTKSVEKMLEVILKFIDAVFYTDPLNGKLTIKLLREAVVTGNEIVLDKSNIVRVIKTKVPNRSKNVNEVKLTFTDRNHKYESRTITSQDLAGFIQAGEKHVTKAIDYPSICDINVARQICDRDLMQLAVPTTSIDLETKRILADSRIGDHIILNDPDIGVINELYRISSIDYGNVDNHNIRVSLISSVYTGAISIYEKKGETEFVDPIGVNSTTDIVNTDLIEMPRRLMLSLLDVVDIELEWGFFVASTQTDKNNFEFDIFLQDTFSGVYSETLLNQEFTPTAVLDQTYIQETAYIDDTHTIRIQTPDRQLAAVSQPDASNSVDPERYFVMNNEWFMYDDIVDEGLGLFSLGNIRRGMFDSVPEEHVAGSTLYFISDTEVIPSESGLEKSRSTARVKLNSRGLGGELGFNSIVTAPIISRQGGGGNTRSFLPESASNVKIGGVAYRHELAVSNSGDIAITWGHRDYEYTFTLPTQSQVNTPLVLPAYNVRIYEEDGTTLIKIINLGIGVTSHTYTLEQEIIDHGRIDDFVVVELETVRGIDPALFRQTRKVYRTGYGLRYDEKYG